MCLDAVMSNAGVFPARLWGGRQHPSLGQAPVMAKRVAESWDQTGKRKWHRGLAAQERWRLPAGQVGWWHKQGGGMMAKKANAKTEMDASCGSQRGPSAPSCPHMGLAIGPWLPATPAKGAGPGVRARRGFPQAFAALSPQKGAVEFGTSLIICAHLAKRLPGHLLGKGGCLNTEGTGRLSAGIPAGMCNEWLSAGMPHILNLII